MYSLSDIRRWRVLFTSLNPLEYSCSMLHTVTEDSSSHILAGSPKVSSTSFTAACAHPYDD